jgi:SAM-dependent methyltransferase
MISEDYFFWLNDYNSRLLKAASAIAGKPKTPGQVMTGEDVDPETLERMHGLRAGTLALPPWEAAQLRELEFWRWVAVEGYLGQDPRLFAWFNENFMMHTFMRTGWPYETLHSYSIVELGCGPLGMINFLPAREATGFDPLNPYYDRLFANDRNKAVNYAARLDQVPSGADLSICHNVIDHADDPAEIFRAFVGAARVGGKLLFQVNVTRPDLPVTDDHRAMHPSPVTADLVQGWMAEVSDDFRFYLSEQPSADNEFYFMAWGLKARDSQARYVRGAESAA